MVSEQVRKLNSMFKNYLITALRSLFKSKLTSFINITGLTLGMAGAIVLLLNIQYEYSVDQFHTNKNNLYFTYSKLTSNGQVECWAASPATLAPAMQKEFPEVKATTRMAAAEKMVSAGEKKMMSDASYVDPSFLHMFSFPLLHGNINTALDDDNSMVITEQFATRLFGSEDPMNKVIQLDNKDNFIIKGVLKDLPGTSSFQFDYLLPWQSDKNKNPPNASWDNCSFSTYVELQPQTNIEAFNKKLANIYSRNSSNKEKFSAFIYPLSKVYLYGKFENGKPAGGRINNVRMLSVLAGIILLIACINFMNLSTARSERRAREVGVRKVMGAARHALIVQFFSESLLLALIAGLLALAVAAIILPAFAAFTHNVQLSIPWQSPRFWINALAFLLFTGIMAGSYPAIYMSSFKPVRVLKGVFKGGGALITPRKILVVVQFVIAVFLINFTLVFKKQLNYSRERETGFVKERLLFHPVTSDIQKNYESLKNELIGSGIASSVSHSNTSVTRGGVGVSGLKWEGMATDANIRFEFLTARSGFVTTNGLTLISGRDIDMDRFAADTNACLINETSARLIGYKNAVGRSIKDEDKNLTIVGVFKDFVIGSPSQAVPPMLVTGSRWGSNLSIRLNNHMPAVQAAQQAEAVIRKYNPGYLTEVKYAEDEYAAKLAHPMRVSILINAFALIAIFISCMGLFALAIFMAENRTKEIGIRKVMGATVTGITTLLTKEIFKPVCIAIAIATPLSWLFAGFFLQQFSYRTSNSVWILVVSAAAAVIIAICTVSFQFLKAAFSNPMRNLRTE